MINTEIFESSNYSNYIAFDNVLKMINDFINENNIKRQNIVEYKTENYLKEEFWNYKVTISYWFNKV